MNSLVTHVRSVLADAQECQAIADAPEDLTEHLTSALQSAGVGIWRWNIPQDAVSWDHHLHRIFGLEPGTFVGGYDAFERLVHPQDREALRDHLAAALLNHAEYETSYRILRPDGSVHCVRSRGKVDRDEHGRAIRMTGVCWDISDRQRAEVRLRESESRVELLQAMIAAAMAISSAPTLQETAERVRERVSEIIGARAGVELAILPAQGLEPHQKLTQQELEEHSWYQALLRKISGGTAPQGLLVVPMRGRHGELLGVLWLADKRTGSFTEEDERLVTHLAQLASNALELHQAHEELEVRVAERTEHLARSNAELEQFAYVASHDLQEPLRAIAGYCDLLHSSCHDQLTAERLEYLQHAIGGAKRMQSLISGLLELSRIRTRAKPLEPVDCQRLLAAVVEQLGPAIAESKAVVACGELPTIQGDSEQITQVFQRLIENAIKFRSERAPQIRVEARLLEGDWLFSVADNGIGIDPLYADRLFVIFQRLHTRAKYAGAGIGLALCKKVVERHGGRIWLESELNQGTTLYFTIPNRGGNDGNGSRVGPPH